MTDREITYESFESLLDWLGPTREEGAIKYQEVRNRLIRILQKKGCSDPEYLADETITRVTLKLPEIRETYVGDPLSYFISVARFVWMESLRLREISYDSLPEKITQPEVDAARDCLHQCLARLPADQRDLVLDYHVDNKRAKIDLHRKMAEELNLSTNALRLRIHRIRMVLEKCVLACLEGAV